MTFGELFTWWMREYGCKLRGNVGGFLRKRLVSHLNRLPLQEVSPAKLEGLLQSQSEELSAKSLNELRGAVHTIFKRATQRGLWHGANPAAGVERRKVARKLFDTLRAEEVPLLLSDISRDPSLAARIVPVLRRGTLLFSLMNLLEIGRTSAQTRESIANLLEGVGSHWAPIDFSPKAVVRRERAGILEPWRDDSRAPWVSASTIDSGNLGKVARRAEPSRSAGSLKLWDEEHAAVLAADVSAARVAVRKGHLRLDGTNDIPAVLDTESVFGTVIQRYVRGSLKVERHQIDDMLHAVVPIVHADVVFLDGPTKRGLLKGLKTRAKVFCKRELEAAFQYLETHGWE